PSSFARTISGTVSSTAALATRTCAALLMPLPSWGNSVKPSRSSAANFSGVRPWSRLRSEPATSAPRPLRIVASGSMPEPPMPQKNQGCEVRSAGVEVIGGSGYCVARALATSARPIVLRQAQDGRGRGGATLGCGTPFPLVVSLSNHELGTTHDPHRHLRALDAD